MKSLKTAVVLALAAMLAAMVFAGCSKQTLSVEGNDNVIEVTAENTTNGTGKTSIEIADGEGIYVYPNVEAGEISITVENEKGQAVYNGSFSGASNPAYITNGISKGSHSVAVVASNASGKLKIGTYALQDLKISPNENTNKEDEDKELSSAAEAAEKAGIDSFNVPASIEIDSKMVGSPKYYVIGHIAQAVYSSKYAMIDLRKAKEPADDISGNVTAHYDYTWTQDVDGINVSCEGDLDKIAKEVLWTDGGNVYSVVVKSDDKNVGLGSDSVANTVKNTK